MPEASELFREGVSGGIDSWEIHQSLFPVVQRVLNPPFINPHLPKMYRICREFIPTWGRRRSPRWSSWRSASTPEGPSWKEFPEVASFPVPLWISNRPSESRIGRSRRSAATF